MESAKTTFPVTAQIGTWKLWKYDFLSEGTYLAPKHLVLLPGLDGTGELFVDFVAALPESWTATTVTYPTDRFLRYADLRPFVGSAVPQLERFVVVAESFFHAVGCLVRSY